MLKHMSMAIVKTLQLVHVNNFEDGLGRHSYKSNADSYCFINIHLQLIRVVIILVITMELASPHHMVAFIVTAQMAILERGVREVSGIIITIMLQRYFVNVRSAVYLTTRFDLCLHLCRLTCLYYMTSFDACLYFYLLTYLC